MHMKFDVIAWWLLVIGGLNWLLVGVGGFLGGNWNLVYMLLGTWPVVEWLVYVLVGLAAVYPIFMRPKSAGSMM